MQVSRCFTTLCTGLDDSYLDQTFDIRSFQPPAHQLARPTSVHGVAFPTCSVHSRRAITALGVLWSSLNLNDPVVIHRFEQNPLHFLCNLIETDRSILPAHCSNIKCLGL